MKAFKRSRGKYVADFEAAEVAILADLVDQVRSLLADRRAETPIDPLAELTGLHPGPAAAPDDPALARLLPDFSRDDPVLAAGLRQLREPELLAAKDSAAVAVLDSLPPGGGQVHLDAATAQMWAAALTDVRLAMGTRLEITTDDEEPAAALADPEGPVAAMFSIYRWLAYVQDSLVMALMD